MRLSVLKKKLCAYELMVVRYGKADPGANMKLRVENSVLGLVREAIQV